MQEALFKLLRVDTSGQVPCPEARNLSLPKLRGLKTLGGVSLAGKFPAVTLSLSDGFESPSGLTDYFSVGLLHIVSEKMKAALQLARAEVELFPVSVLYEGQTTKIKYFAANTMLRLEAVDREKSTIDFCPETNMALSITKLVLNEALLIGHSLAMIAEIQHIAVSPNLVSALRMAGCTGCSFVAPETVEL